MLLPSKLYSAVRMLKKLTDSKTLSQSRCVIARDAGYTRADATGTKIVCLFFARGCCPYG